MYRKAWDNIITEVLGNEAFCGKRNDFDIGLAYISSAMFFVFFVITTPLWFPVYVLGKIMRKKGIE